MIKKDVYGWGIGKWNSIVSIRYFTATKFVQWGLKFYCKYWELYLGRMKIRVWKPKFMRCFFC
jgi:hypothetical protein